MASPASINPRIIEALYGEALVLADEVRACFALNDRLSRKRGEDAAQIALSCEGLRTTTRMMHALAWLLNHRAYCAGEISEFQLRRHGKLAESPPADPERLACLDPPVRELVLATERFHARLARLDQDWRAPAAPRAGAIAALRERLGLSVPG